MSAKIEKFAIKTWLIYNYWAVISWWRHLLLKKDLGPSAILDPPF